VKILHTSDWHIGRTLHDKKRTDEYQAFFSWLLSVITEQQIDLLLICGDVFDSIAPGNRNLELYYDFLKSVVDAGCSHVVVTGGNHDSPSLLNAPKEILGALGIQVIGGALSAEDEVLLLRDAAGEPEAIVCAVPYLRDRDVRTAGEQQSSADAAQALIAGIADHYEAVRNHALKLRSSLKNSVPILVTGHLFTSGGKTIADDGVRDLYVGTAAQVPHTIFPAESDYVALGHLHVAQTVASCETIRYSGSPIPMGFGESGRKKVVVLVEFSAETLFPHIAEIPVPQFQQLRKIEGTGDEIEKQLERLAAADESVWVEIVYTGTLSPSALSEHLEELVQQTPIEILRVRNTLVSERMLHGSQPNQTLDELDEWEIFRRRLDHEDIEIAERALLHQLYESVLFSFGEEES